MKLSPRHRPPPRLRAPIAPAMSAVAPVTSAAQPSSQSSTPIRQNPWTTGSLSSSVSSTGSTVSLPGREDRVALANAEVMEVVRQALRSELEPINQRLGKLSDAVEMQGSNIASLTDMVDDIGERLRNVEAKESATQQRLARMREEFQQRQLGLVKLRTCDQNSLRRTFKMRRTTILLNLLMDPLVHCNDQGWRALQSACSHECHDL